MIIRRSIFAIILIFISAVNLFSLDINDGNIRLRINERTGNYSLFYLTDPENSRYEPLFYSGESDASYLSVSVDGNVYRLGKSNEFNIRVETVNGKASVVYQSSFLTVTETFTPVRTLSFPSSNGIRIDITLRNNGDQSVSAGLRLLLDTNLGEGRNNIPFLTNNLEIKNEQLVEGSSGQLYWVSRSQNLSLMGTIVNPFTANSKTPNFLHFANWKRLNTAPWKLNYVQERSFDYRPYYVSDSAVCYYYEQDRLEKGDSVSYTIFLTTEDIPWYNMGAAYDFSSNQTSALAEIIRMQEILEKFIAGEISLSKHDLDEIENNVNRLRASLN